jgi:RNA polymerase sigma-70 factor (ECF subfamily)
MMFGFGKSKTEIYDDFEREAIPLMGDIYRVAMWLVRDISEAEDLTQETLTQAFKSFHRYEIGTNCKAWVMKILYHLNSKRLRKLNRLQLVEDTEEKIAETIAFEPSIPQNITDGEVLEALKKIPQQFSQVVVLADVEDFSYREISQILDVPIGTVMSRLHRGRKLLRIELAEYAKTFGFGIEKKVGEMR